MTGKILKVPLIKQPKKSMDCGPACTAMVLKHFGKPRSVASIRKGLYYDRDGTYLYEHGTILQQAGLKTTIVTAHPWLFPSDIIARVRKRPAALDEWLTKFFDYHKKNRDLQRSWRHLRKYLDAGGRLQPAIPTIRHVRSAIRHGSPAIATIHGGALGRTEGWGYHFVVVDGIRPGAVHVRNPAPDSKRGWISDRELLYALHSSTSAAFGNGDLLVVSR